VLLECASDILGGGFTLYSTTIIVMMECHHVLRFCRSTTKWTFRSYVRGPMQNTLPAINMTARKHRCVCSMSHADSTVLIIVVVVVIVVVVIVVVIVVV